MLSIKKAFCGKRPAAVRNPLVCEQQKPGPKAAFIGIELLDRSKDIQESLLDSILRFGIIAQNAPGDAEEASGVPLKQYGQSISIPTLQVPRQRFI